MIALRFLSLGGIAFAYGSAAWGIDCQGIVHDQDPTTNPLHSVKIEVQNSTLSTFTNLKGEFTLTFPGGSKCSDYKIKASATTLNGDNFFSEIISLSDGSVPKKIPINQPVPYVSCGFGIGTKYKLYLHAPWPGAKKKFNKSYHTPHILRVGSVHSKEARYKAEVKCLQKRLEELGFKSGVVKQMTEKIKVKGVEKTVKNLKYHHYSDRNFSTATTNTPGLYDNDEALAVWQFQGLAMCQSPTGALPRLPSRCKSKIFGKIRYKAKQVDKTTVKILNATNGNPFWKWAQFQPQQCAPPNSAQKCLWRKKWKQPQVEWGTKALIEVLQNAAKALDQASASGTANYRGIEIGDISYPTGGNIAGHGSHERGIDVDINTRSLCTDGTTQYGAIEYWQTAPCPYDQAYMEVLLKALAAQKYVDKLLFHDPAFLPGGARYNNIPESDRRKITCSNYQQYTPCPGNSHTHHIHMRLKWEN